MRQARKRALSRRKPLQIGYGITFSVFLALAGLMVFERIILGVVFVSLSHNPATDSPLFLHGPDATMGPFDWMAVALAGLLFAQGFRAFQAWRRKEGSWSGFAFGACNIGIVAMLSCILVINWAFYHPLSSGARHINGLSYLLNIRSFQYEAMEHLPRAPVWEQLDARTFCHPGAEIIERHEIIKPGFPIEHQQANWIARNPDQPKLPYDSSRWAMHYYDLEWNLLTIHASTNWPTVRAKLDEVGKEEYSLGYEIWQHLDRSRQTDASTLPSCADRVPRPFPAPTYPPPRE